MARYWIVARNREGMALILAIALLAGLVLAQDENGQCQRQNIERAESQENLPQILAVRPLLNCSTPGIDAATFTPDQKTYFFKGDYYWRLIESDVAPGYPRLISQDWDGLPGYLDAALTWTDQRTFFFKGSKYWSFHGKTMDQGYPKNISDGFCGIPDNIDAAVVWKTNNRAYFFKGSDYWRFDGGEFCDPVPKKFPRPISEWDNIPSNLDAAIQWEDGRTYFFKGGYYYKYNDDGTDVEAGRPVEIDQNWGVKCQDLLCRFPASSGPPLEDNLVSVS